MYVGYTNIFSTPKGIFISDIYCIRYAGYKNIPDIRILYAIPNDVLITGIHCNIMLSNPDIASMQFLMAKNNCNICFEDKEY